MRVFHSKPVTYEASEGQQAVCKMLLLSIRTQGGLAAMARRGSSNFRRIKRLIHNASNQGSKRIQKCTAPNRYSSSSSNNSMRKVSLKLHPRQLVQAGGAETKKLMQTKFLARSWTNSRVLSILDSRRRQASRTSRLRIASTQLRMRAMPGHVLCAAHYLACAKRARCLQRLRCHSASLLRQWPRIRLLSKRCLCAITRIRLFSVASGARRT